MSVNPLLSLPYEPAIESLGDAYFDVVAAAEFPQQILRFRNNDLLLKLGLDPAQVSDADFVEAFGKFQGRDPFLALRYHGYQFGHYNPDLGDGRGFLYGQVRGTDGELYDFGTKGSGKTPYSRGGDGRLTLKGGVREVLAAEMLHVLGVRTSRCLSLIETGEPLWRGDEPSPTRSSVMIRMQRSHIRFGTFERLYAIDRPDLIRKLLDHVIDCYYPHLNGDSDTVPGAQSDRYARFYAELVQRVAELAAQWMSVGFCHAVLNTDNMSITGESFDYGPYAFIDRYDPDFTAAYFDYGGRYRYSYQPLICRLNLELLQVPLKCAIDPKDLEAAIDQFEDYYHDHYRQRMLQKLGFDQLSTEAGDTVPGALRDQLLQLTLQQLKPKEIGYHEFFLNLRKQFSPDWKTEVKFDDASTEWQAAYQQAIASLTDAELQQVRDRLQQHNPDTILLRPEIETVWEAIDQADNWQLFEDLLDRIRKSVNCP